MTKQTSIGGFEYADAKLNASHSYLVPALLRELDLVKSANTAISPKLFEVGCGNGSVASFLTKSGWDVTGIDPSAQGIGNAKNAYPRLKLEIGSTSDDLASKYGQFSVVFSLEVVEHVYAPREFARSLFTLTQSGGTVILSTPYHGYLKNLAMAVTGKMDNHFTALSDHGHIKFWSIRTLSILLEEAGFRDIKFLRVGRFPPLAKSMVAVARKP